MRNTKHAAGLVLATGLGLMAVALAVTGLATTLAAGPVDLVLDMRAPAHVAPDSAFVVNVAYANVGTGDAPDARVTATLPDGCSSSRQPTVSHAPAAEFDQRQCSGMERRAAARQFVLRPHLDHRESKQQSDRRCSADQHCQHHDDGS